jgi:uncharacterized protein (TIGR02147 family)
MRFEKSADDGPKTGEDRPMSFQYVTEHREYLRKELNQRIQRRPLYSQRAFARDLGLSASSLGDYLKGTMRLSAGRICQISKTIGLTAEQRQHWIDLLDEKFAKSQETRQLAQLRVKARLQAQTHSISVDQFKVISEWFHLAYLELIDMDTQKYSDPKTAAASLGVPVKSLKIAIKRLSDVGFLKKDENGFFQVDPSTRLGDSVPSEAIRQYHTQILKRATQAIETQDMSRRFNSSTIIALPKKDVEKILAELQTVALKFLDPYSEPSTSKDSLYCLSLQFFDLLSASKGTSK